MTTSSDIVCELMNIINKYMADEPVQFLDKELKNFASKIRRDNDDLIDAAGNVELYNDITGEFKGHFMFQFSGKRREYCAFES